MAHQITKDSTILTELSLLYGHYVLSVFALPSCCSVTQSCPTLCDLMDCSMPGLSVHQKIPEPAQTLSIESVMPSNNLVLCHVLLLPSIFPSIRVFSSESVLHIRWPKNWSFSFSIRPSNEYSGLISCKIDWFDLLAVQGTPFQ